MKNKVIPLMICTLFLVVSCNNNSGKNSSSSQSEDLYESYLGDKSASEWRDNYKDIIDIDNNKNSVPDWQEEPISIVFASDFYDDDDSLNTIYRNA
jgi:multiple sugar transport system substrate-binding protein